MAADIATEAARAVAGDRWHCKPWAPESPTRAAPLSRQSATNASRTASAPVLALARFAPSDSQAASASSCRLASGCEASLAKPPGLLSHAKRDSCLADAQVRNHIFVAVCVAIFHRELDFDVHAGLLIRRQDGDPFSHARLGFDRDEPQVGSFSRLAAVLDANCSQGARKLTDTRGRFDAMSRHEEGIDGP